MTRKAAMTSSLLYLCVMISTFDTAEPAHGENTLDRGLIAHYPFDQDTADVAARRPATNHFATPVADGRIGGALAFDGKSSYVALPMDLTAGLRQWSFSLWVRTKQSDAKPREQFWKNPTILGVATPGPGSADFGITTENGRAAALWTKVTGKAVDVIGPPTLPLASPAGGPVEATIELKNSQGLRWQLEKRCGHWTLGTLFVHDKPLDAPLASGIVALSNVTSRQVFWPAATEAKQLDKRSARFTGSEKIGDVLFRFEVDVALKEDVPAATLAPRWSVDKELNGFEVCLAYQGVGTNDWRVQSYPFAGNSERAAITPMRYCGVPGALVYRPDLSMVVLFAIDMQFDYLNRRTAPQFRCGGGKLSAGVRYEHPVQLFVSDTGEFASTIKSIMENWIKANHYKVDESLSVRTPQEAFQITLKGRRKMASWKPGIGYEHHKGTPFVYVGNNPYIAYYEYRLYEMTGDPEWRKRAFEQIDFALKGQQTDRSKPNYGVMHTSWYFRRQGEADGFCSWDWGHNGYKVDLNACMARYILQTWQRVKQHEGLDCQDWYKAAVAAADWAIAQQNADGGGWSVTADSSGVAALTRVSW